MISRIRGVLLTRDLERIEVLTPGGVVYEIEVPLTIFQRLPDQGHEVEIRTFHSVREDSESLFGFLEPIERQLFGRLLAATGVGPKLALAMMSTFPPDRLARALVEKDVAILTQVSGIGKKKAERIILELGDKMADLAISVAPAQAMSVQGAPGAVAALVGLGYSYIEADQAVRMAIEEESPDSTEELIRIVLSRRSISKT